MIYTILSEIRKHGPRADGWAKLLGALGKTEADDEPLSLLQILEINGMQDAIWAIRAVEGMDGPIRELACRFAESVLPVYEKEFPDDKRPRNAIDAARRYARGEATKGEMAAASDAAWAAASAAASAAARAAASDAAWTAASDDAMATTWDDVEVIFRQWLTEFSNEVVG